MLVNVIFLWRHPHITPAPHCSPSSVRTPTYHSSSSLLSILCLYTHLSLQLLTALLPLFVHPHITPILTALIPLSSANNENGQRQAELHEGSHAQQLGQLANSRAGDRRRSVYKEAFQPTSSVSAGDRSFGPCSY